jgi:hypothetical protein
MKGLRINHVQNAKTIEFKVPDSEQVITAALSYDPQSEAYNVTINSGAESATFGNVSVSGDVTGYVVEMEGKRSKCNLVTNDGKVHMFSGGKQTVLGLPLPGYLQAVDETHEGDVLTPMPCKISQVYKLWFTCKGFGHDRPRSEEGRCVGAFGGNEDGACYPRAKGRSSRSDLV